MTQVDLLFLAKNKGSSPVNLSASCSLTRMEAMAKQWNG